MVPHNVGRYLMLQSLYVLVSKNHQWSSLVPTATYTIYISPLSRITSSLYILVPTVSTLPVVSTGSCILYQSQQNTTGPYSLYLSQLTISGLQSGSPGSLCQSRQIVSAWWPLIYIYICIFFLYEIFMYWQRILNMLVITTKMIHVAMTRLSG